MNEGALRYALTRVERLRKDLGVLAEKPRQADSLPRLVPPGVEELLRALRLFPTLAGYLNGRRPSGSLMVIGSEAAVQDLLFVALKPIFPDLVYEQPTQKGASGFSIGDFHLPSLRLILEAKYIGRREDVAARAREVSEDIWRYTNQTDCEYVLFFVFDPYHFVPDRVNFASSLSARSGQFKSSGRDVQIITVIE